MSSGSLPLGTYHRAQALGSGSYGSVLTVYDDDGEQFALKLFVDDDSDDDDDDEGDYSEDESSSVTSSTSHNEDVYRTTDLSALREISILRLLRDENSHPNVVHIHDVTTDDRFCDEDGEDADGCGGGAGTGGYMGIAMPMFPMGNLSDAIDNGLLVQPKGAKVQIAHGLLSAVAFLHHNGIIHRDIKGDNVMIEALDDGSFRPVLIDFSLAKVVGPGPLYRASSSEQAVTVTMRNGFGSTEGEDTHTPAVGTPTYKAPEVVSSLPYGLPSDLYSVGVVLLELRRGRTLETSRDKGAARLVVEEAERLPDRPFAALIRGLVEVDPKLRWTAKKALESEVFRPLWSSSGGDGDCKGGVKHYRTVDISEALPLEDDFSDEQPELSTKGKQQRNKHPNRKLQNRYRTIQKIAHDLECDHPLTTQAALTYSIQMSQLEDDIDDLRKSQALVDCVVLAHRMFEREAWCLRSLEKKVANGEILKGCGCDWMVETYGENEGSLWMLMDFCLYPRKLLDL